MQLVRVLRKLLNKSRSVRRSAFVKRTFSIRRKNYYCATLQKTVLKSKKRNPTKLHAYKNCSLRSKPATRSRSNSRPLNVRRKKLSSKRLLSINAIRTQLNRQKLMRPLELLLRRKRSYRDFLLFKKKLTTAKPKSMRLKPREPERKPISWLVVAPQLRS